LNSTVLDTAYLNQLADQESAFQASVLKSEVDLVLFATDRDQIENEEVCPVYGGVHFHYPLELNYEVYEPVNYPNCRLKIG